MEERIIQAITDMLRKELAPIKLDILDMKKDIVSIKKELAAIKLDILEIKQEQITFRNRMSRLELEFHKFRVGQERQDDNIAVIIENIKTAAENRAMLLNHDTRIKKLEAA